MKNWVEALRKRMLSLKTSLSAGGGLALALTMFIRDHRLPMPCGVVTMSAWTDLTKSGDSYRENYDTDY